MGRQIPKNVRQIGNVSDNSKIYIEDYVDIFLNQLSEKTDDKAEGAFLVGEVTKEGENDFIFIHGAIKMQNHFRIEEDEWKYACETCKEYFGDAEILGWVKIGNEQPFEMNHDIQKMHQKYFKREKSIFMFKSCRDKEERIFLYKYREMLEMKGHYIFYEKNEEMQDYMIANRRNAGITPSETLDDQAAKSFRSIIQEKMEHKEKKRKFRPAYVLVAGCMLAVLGVGFQNVRNENVEEAIKDVSSQEVVEQIEPPVDEIVLDEPIVEEEVQETAGVQMEEIYIVEKGDTIESISEEVYGDIAHISAICELNGLGDGNLIFIGQKLLLP